MALACQVESIYGASRNNKLADAKFVITPHPQFVAEVVKANAAASQKRLKRIN